MLRKILKLLVGSALAIGLLFKFMNWPGGLVMLIVSVLGVVVVLLENCISKLKSKEFIKNSIYSLLGIIYVLGILFKVMNLKGSDIMLIVSIVGLSFAMLQFSFSIRKSLNSIFPLFFSVTLIFVLFKILHWPMPQFYLTYASYFAFAFLLPGFMFLQVKKLKESNLSLKKHYILLGILFLVIFILECITKATEFEKIDLIPLNYLMIINIVLFFSTVLAISKTLRIKNLKLEFNNDYKLLKSIELIYMIILLLFVLIKAN